MVDLDVLRQYIKNGDDFPPDLLAEVVEEITALRAKVTALKGWHPASEKPSDQRDIMLMVDGEEKRGWCGKTTGHYYQSEDYPPAQDTIVTPSAWREL